MILYCIVYFVCEVMKNIKYLFMLIIVLIFIIVMVLILVGFFGGLLVIVSDFVDCVVEDICVSVYLNEEVIFEQISVFKVVIKECDGVEDVVYILIDEDCICNCILFSFELFVGLDDESIFVLFIFEILLEKKR